MDVHVPEFELRWHMAVRLMRALPLLAALTVMAGIGLYSLHVPLFAVLLGAAVTGLLAAVATTRIAGTPATAGTRQDPVLTADSLTSA